MFNEYLPISKKGHKYMSLGWKQYRVSVHFRGSNFHNLTWKVVFFLYYTQTLFLDFFETSALPASYLCISQHVSLCSLFVVHVGVHELACVQFICVLAVDKVWACWGLRLLHLWLQLSYSVSQELCCLCQELLQHGSHVPELCLHYILKCFQEVLLKVNSVVPTRWLLFGT